MYNVFNWIEIPAADLDRAVKFYNTILNDTCRVEDFMGMKMAILPMGGEKEGAGGALVEADGFKPSTEGTLAYLNSGHDLSTVLSRVEGAGGKIIMPKTSIGEPGYIALIIDCEGNKVGLHSMN